MNIFDGGNHEKVPSLEHHRHRVCTCYVVLFQNRHNVQDIAFLRIHSSVKMSLETVLVKRFSKLRKRRILNG